MKFLHHTFFGSLAVLAVGTLMMVTMGQSGGLNPMLTLMCAIAVFLLSSGKVITYNHRSILRNGKRFFWDQRYILSTALVFLLLMAACFLFLQLQDLSYIYQREVPEGVTVLEHQQRQLDSGINLYVLLFGCLLLWYLYFQLLFCGGERGFFSTVGQFTKSYVTVFLIYRLAVFLLALVGGLLTGLGRGDVQGEYLLFVADDETVQGLLEGSVNGSGFFSGVTEASSFFVLSTMAAEALRQRDLPSFRQRCRRVFLDLDTFKLLIMTVASILVGFLGSGSERSFLGNLLNTAMIILWLVSMVSFLADTLVWPYLLNFFTLGFLERLIPMPEFGGIGGLGLSLLVALVRIVAFGVVAVMIAQHDIHRTEPVGVFAPLRRRIAQATFLDLIICLERLCENGLFGLKKKSHDEDDMRFVVRMAKKVDDFLEKLLGLSQD